MPTPLPLSTVADYDGRHHVIPIMAHWECDGTEPYHPLVAQVLTGRGHADKETALALANLIVTAVNSHASLVARCADLESKVELANHLVQQLTAVFQAAGAPEFSSSFGAAEWAAQVKASSVRCARLEKALGSSIDALESAMTTCQVIARRDKGTLGVEEMQELFHSSATEADDEATRIFNAQYDARSALTGTDANNAARAAPQGAK